MTRRLLVVEDDKSTLDYVAKGFEELGWVAERHGDGRDGLHLATSAEFDLIILDRNLPGMDGLSVLKAIRAAGLETPVIILSAISHVDERVKGLRAGGDDYVTKPFSIEEVVLRLRALLRRTGVTTVDSGAQLVVGDLVLDEDSHEVARAGEPISLTSTEFELLRFMMRNSKRVLSKAQILDRVWSYDFGGRSKLVELYISYLRKKIDNGREPMIHTLRGAGYVLKPPR